MILEQLGIFGWQQREENLLLASLLTGDPLLLIGRHGCAKTYLASQIARSLNRRFVAYDASKAMFEDVLGYPNLAKLKRGIVEYVPSPLTIWDKDMILIDELNRPLPELQSKWLEIIRSRRIMGLPTQIRWAWAAMNPQCYLGTHALDRALLGRFALFVYPPEVLDMSEADRIKVTQAASGDDAPALGVWWAARSAVPAQMSDATAPALPVSATLSRTLRTAARRFRDLKEDLDQLPLFLSRFAELVRGESQGQIALDGRRLGFLYRNILAYRAVELAQAGLDPQSSRQPLTDSMRFVVTASIPIGLDEELPDPARARHVLELCCDLLSDFFKPGAPMSRLDAIYELCTTRDLRRKVEILLQQDLADLVKCKGWQELVTSDTDVTPLAYTALEVEALRPGTIPPEMLSSLSQRIAPHELSDDALPPLKDEDIEYLDEMEGLLASARTGLEKAVAISHVKELTEKGNLTPAAIAQARQRIQSDLAWLRELLGSTDAEGRTQDEDHQTVA